MIARLSTRELQRATSEPLSRLLIRSPQPARLARTQAPMAHHAMSMATHLLQGPMGRADTRPRQIPVFAINIPMAIWDHEEGLRRQDLCRAAEEAILLVADMEEVDPMEGPEDPLQA